MDRTDVLFLKILNASVGNAPLTDGDVISRQELKAVFGLSRIHRVLPLAEDQLYKHFDESRGERGDLAPLRAFYREARKLVIDQAARTAGFYLIYEAMRKECLEPAVMKGLILRSLYPKPGLRASVDEDLLIKPEEIGLYDRFLKERGFMPTDPDADITREFELSYENKQTGLYLELHKQPFSPESEAYGDCNTFFEGALQRTVIVTIDGISFRTLCPTDHLLYLLCHAYKHFLHGGFGIRQVFDIGLFTEKYAEEIDWEEVVEDCRKIRILTFSGAIYGILKKKLGAELSGLPAGLSGDGIDEQPLLQDILEGGLYGAEDPDRHHSAAVTINAVAASKTGKRPKGLFAAAFPGKEYLERHYPYAKNHPILLPAAWAQRIVTYLGDKKKNDPGKSLSIGRSRVELLREYGIIDD